MEIISGLQYSSGLLASFPLLPGESHCKQYEALKSAKRLHVNNAGELHVFHASITLSMPSFERVEIIKE